MQIASNGDNLQELPNPVSIGENLHEMPNPLFWKKYHQFVVF